MTRAHAIDTARALATNHAGVRFAVYRFAAWRPDVFGVRDLAQLPKEAETFETYGDPVPVVDTEKSRGQQQGGLFS